MTGKRTIASVPKVEGEELLDSNETIAADDESEESVVSK